MANNTKETYRWKVMLKRHRPSNRPDVCVFYDEDKNTALKEMRKYVKNLSSQDKYGIIKSNEIYK